jgi:hypothetical protein
VSPEAGNSSKKNPLGRLRVILAPMNNVISYARVEKVRELRASWLEAERRLAATIKAGGTWAQIEAEEEKAAMIVRKIKAVLSRPVE